MVMVVGVVSVVDISDIVGDFSGHRISITCRMVKMKGFIEVTAENGAHLLNMKYIESSGTQYVDTGVVPNNKGGVHYIDKNRIEAAVKTLRRRTERGEER